MSSPLPPTITAGCTDDCSVSGPSVPCTVAVEGGAAAGVSDGWDGEAEGPGAAATGPGAGAGPDADAGAGAGGGDAGGDEAVADPVVGPPAAVATWSPPAAGPAVPPPTPPPPQALSHKLVSATRASRWRLLLDCMDLPRPATIHGCERMLSVQRTSMAASGVKCRVGQGFCCVSLRHRRVRTRPFGLGWRSRAQFRRAASVTIRQLIKS